MSISAPKTDLISKSPMNRIISYYLATILCLIVNISLHSTNISNNINFHFNDTEVERQVMGLTDIIDIKYNAEVKSIINTYITIGKNNSEVILSRSNYYFPIMENIIRKHNMPEEIKYLAVIESGLRPTVKSRVGAVGLWQFMSSTAKYYDLRIGNTFDERKEVTRSTEAALRYLNDLYERFGDWTLALAAYNCGPGNVNKAIRKAGGAKNYWEIRNYLPRETRRYLPKFIATMYVMNYFEQLGLELNAEDYTEHKAFGIAYIQEKTTFNTISKLSGLDISNIKKYNPSYTHNYIPASSKGNSLILPEIHLLTYLKNLGKMDKLHHVFYLKSALFTNPESLNPSESIMPAESTKINTDEILALNLVDFFELPSHPLTLEIKSEDAMRNPAVQQKLFRLRKRQTLLEFLNENNLKQSDIKSISEDGVVVFNPAQ